MASVTQNFNALKKKHPGMTDSEAMKKAMALTAESRKKVRKADKKKSKKLNWAEKLKAGVTKQLSKKSHSPAGRKHRARSGY
jgi:hypothetical protein